MKLFVSLWLASSWILLGNFSQACPDSIYPIVAGGGNGSGNHVGEVVIRNSDTDSSLLDVTVSITGDLTPDDDSDDSSLTKIYEVHAEANCALAGFPLTKKGNPQVGLFDATLYLSEGVSDVTIQVRKPDCGGSPILVAVHTHLEKKGGVDSFNSIFPAPVKYYLKDDDSNVYRVGASYFDAIFQPGSTLEGITLDSWCVDIGHSISPGGTYTGTAYSYLEDDLSSTNIDYPQNLDSVAWVVNNFKVGSTYDIDIDNDGVKESYVMAAGTMALIIWKLVDNYPNPAGYAPGPYSAPLAAYIVEQALENDGFIPGCNDFFPIVLREQTGNRQDIIGVASFGDLNIPCETIAEDTAWAVQPGTSPIGYPFVQKGNWATYVMYDDCV